VLTEAQAQAAPVKSHPGQPGRLMAVDALRGFDMFWIIGAGSLVSALHGLRKDPVTSFFADQLEHADWQGFKFEDLIFPLFVFLAGISLVFSLTKALECGDRSAALKRVFRRGILLFVVALFYSGGFRESWPHIRLMGVLNRIALAYFFAGLLFCFFKPRALAGICVGLLVGYWALMTFVPIRNIQLTRSGLEKVAEQRGDTNAVALFQELGRRNPSGVKDSPAWAAAQNLFYATTERVSGKYDKGLNLANHVDFQYLPGFKYDSFFDPEGYLSTIPAIATCLLGVFAGFLLRNPGLTDQRKVALLACSGLAAAVLGWLWGLQFPVIKKIWTSSYVLVAGGYSALLLAAFYQIVEIWQLRGWCQPFVWMGMNSITIYLTANILDSGFGKLARRFAGGDVETFFDSHVADGFGGVVIALVGLALAFWFVHFLHKKKIFLRL